MEVNALVTLYYVYFAVSWVGAHKSRWELCSWYLLGRGPNSGGHHLSPVCDTMPLNKELLFTMNARTVKAMKVTEVNLFVQ